MLAICVDPKRRRREREREKIGEKQPLFSLSLARASSPSSFRDVLSSLFVFFNSAAQGQSALQNVLFFPGKKKV